MYREELKRPPISGLKGFLMIVAMVAAVLGLMFIVGFVQYVTGVNFLQFILFGGVVLFCIFYVKKYMTQYIYVILKDRVCFGRRIGRREKDLAEFPFRSIVACGHFTDKMRKRCEGLKRYTLTYLKQSDKTVCVLLKDCYYLIDVSDEFVKRVGEYL